MRFYTLRKHPFLTTVVGASAAFLLAASLLGPHIVIQVTPSMPRGVYWITRGADITTGAIVVFEPPLSAKKLIDERRWWNMSGVRYSLMKYIVAKTRDHVQVSDDVVLINGSFFSTVKHIDSQGLPLTPSKLDTILAEDEYFVASKYHNSFDSRYFGTIKREDIKGTATRIF
jgi:conjugative transfer signal peptidase TraF